MGPDEVFRNVSTFTAAFPDVTADVENVIINKENDDSFKAFLRLRFKGLNTGLS